MPPRRNLQYHSNIYISNSILVLQISFGFEFWCMFSRRLCSYWPKNWLPDLGLRFRTIEQSLWRRIERHRGFKSFRRLFFKECSWMLLLRVVEVCSIFALLFLQMYFFLPRPDTETDTLALYNLTLLQLLQRGREVILDSWGNYWSLQNESGGLRYPKWNCLNAATREPSICPNLSILQLSFQGSHSVPVLPVMSFPWVNDVPMSCRCRRKSG